MEKKYSIHIYFPLGFVFLKRNYTLLRARRYKTKKKKKLKKKISPVKEKQETEKIIVHRCIVPF